MSPPSMHSDIDHFQPQREALLPPIMLSADDLEQLHEIAVEAMMGSPRLAGALLDELRRAEVRLERHLPTDVVRLGSLVVFSDLSNPEQRPKKVQLLAPSEVSGDHSTVSVLTPMGTALLGLRVGQTIVCPDRSGGFSRLVVLGVKNQQRSTNKSRQPD